MTESKTCPCGKVFYRNGQAPSRWHQRKFCEGKCPTNRRNGYWTKARIIQQIQDLAKIHGRTPSSTMMGRPLVEACNRVFGHVSTAQAAAGCVPNKGGNPRNPMRAVAPRVTKPEPIDTVAEYGIDLDAERAKHKARQAKRAAEEQAKSARLRELYPRQSRKRRGDFGAKYHFRDDYLPPPDLTRMGAA